MVTHDGHPALEDRRSNPSFVGIAASVMLRRHFSTLDRREVTRYVLELFGGGRETSRKCRTAEMLIRGELGELELTGELPSRNETYELALVILDDLIARSELGQAQLMELIAVADRESRSAQRVIKERKLSPKDLLTRALRRRAGN